MSTTPASIVESMFFANNLAMFGGFTLSFVRGGQSIDNIPANRGKSNLVVDVGGGARIEAVSSDFIVLARYLVLASVPITPKKGDRLQFVENGKTQLYELMSPPMDPSDHAGVLVRLHSKFLSAT